MSKKRIIFAGTPDFAAIHLQALLEKSKQDNCDFEIVAVYTQMDRPAGRGHKLTFSPVKQIALEHNLPVYQPLNFKDPHEVEKFKALNATLAVVVAYGIILPQEILSAPTLGCINVHGSLLPKLRGAAPIQRALFNGDEKTGITIMQIVPQLDAGPMLLKREINIEKDDTSLSLFDKLAHLGANTLKEELSNILAQKYTPIEQDESEVSFACKLSKEESPLDFNLSAHELDLKIRAFNPWPIANATIDQVVYKIFGAKVDNNGIKLEDIKDYANGTIVDINKEGIVVKCHNSLLTITTIQAPGKGKVSASDYARSKHDIFARGKCFAN